MANNKIIFINQSSGYLMIDIINAFKNTYKERVLFTGFLGKRDTPLDDGVKIKWLFKYNRKSTFKRLLTWSLAFFKSIFLIKFKYKNAHLFLVSNPPFAILIPFFCKNEYSLLIYDVYPDALVEFKIFKNDSLIIRLWKKANLKIYKKATHVYTITNEMKGRLSQYSDPNKIKVIPIWADNNFLKPMSKFENIFLKQHGLENKFVVIYSGNLGKSHPVEVLLEVAKEFELQNEIVFIIIGEGDKYEFIKKEIKILKLSNVLLFPWQEAAMLPYTLSAADIAVVTLSKEVSDLSIPSKTYSLMSVGVPILCIASETSALSKLITHHEMGKTCSQKNKTKIVNFIKECKKNPLLLEKLKENSFKASLDYTPENAKLFV